MRRLFTKRFPASGPSEELKQYVIRRAKELGVEISIKENETAAVVEKAADGVVTNPDLPVVKK